MKLKNWRYPKWALGIGSIFLGVWIMGLLPPLLEHFGILDLSRNLRFVYRFLCHGIPSRCPWILNRPAAVCFRCSGIDTSFFLAAAVFFPFLRDYLTWKNTMVLSVTFSAFMFIEWILEFSNIINSIWWLQLGTGFLFGGSVSLLVCSLMDEAINSFQSVPVSVRSEESSDL